MTSVVAPNQTGDSDMCARGALFVAGMILLLSSVDGACAAQTDGESAESPARSAAGGLFGGGMAQAAEDLRKAGEAFERFANALNGPAEVIAKSLATMSSEFDPFGYKTAFRTVGRQTEIIQQQNKIINAMQEREIERLRRENRRLKRELQNVRPPRRERGERPGGRRPGVAGPGRGSPRPDRPKPGPG